MKYYIALIGPDSMYAGYVDEGADIDKSDSFKYVSIDEELYGFIYNLGKNKLIDAYDGDDMKYLWIRLC